MKKTLLIIITLFIAKFCTSQIDVLESTKEREYIKPDKFDSSFNYGTYENTLKLTGQTIFFIPHSKKYISEKYKQQIERKFKVDTVKYSTYFLTKNNTNVGKILTPSQIQANHISDSIFLSSLQVQKSRTVFSKKNPPLSIEDYPELKKLRPYDPKPISTTIYKPVFKDEFNLATPLKSIESKYYKIKGIFKKYHNQINCTFLDLVSKDDPSDSLTFIISEGGDNNKILKQNVPYILQSFYEKQKVEVLGKKFISKNPIASVYDIITGKIIKIDTLDKEWVCSSLTFIETQSNYNLELCMIMKQDDKTIAVNYSNGMDVVGEVAETISINNFKSEKDVKYEKLRADEIDKQKKEDIERIAQEQKKAETEKLLFQSEMIKKYGSKVGKLIANNKVIIGMSKEQCRLSWGDPADINSTITQNIVFEQWVYSMSSYLYFENNVLVAIQN